MKSEDGKIHVKRKRAKGIKENSTSIWVSIAAWKKIAEIADKSSENMRDIASKIILQGAELIVFDDIEEEEE